MARVQMNVRIDPETLAAIDARRATQGLSRDEWMRRALDYLLALPAPTTPQEEHPS